MTTKEPFVVYGVPSGILFRLFSARYYDTPLLPVKKRKKKVAARKRKKPSKRRTA